ncbi:MAG: succinylglutamate desuccinylase/aspartoacylase family protein [bacterium]
MPSLFTYFQSAPPFTVWKSHPGQKSRVLITGGIDGDEYAGIEIAKKLIASYDLSIPITVIPIVNLAGYKNKISYNPLDGRYPKHIFPGSVFGSSSSRLMHEVSKYAKGVDLWIDLHCGAIGETLIPFAWAPEAYPVLSYLNTRVLVEKSVNKNIPYVMLEGGELPWIYTLIKNLDKPIKPGWQPTYTNIKYEKYQGQPITKDVLWWSKTNFVTAS